MESKLSVSDRHIELAVATTPGIGADSVAIRHEPEIKGGLKALTRQGPEDYRLQRGYS